MTLATAPSTSFIITRDRAVSDRFYEDVLGLVRLPGDPFASVYALGEAGRLRITEVPDFAASAHTVLGWDVSDIASAIDALVAKGVSFTVYDGFGQDSRGIWTSPDGGAKVAWFTDPDGNVLSLTAFTAR